MKISEKDFVTISDDKTFIWEIIKINKHDMRIKLIAKRTDLSFKLISESISNVSIGYKKVFVTIDKKTKTKLLKLITFQ